MTESTRTRIDLRRRCASCRRFLDNAVELERALPGILILSSTQGDAWGDQGICRLYQRLATPEMSCPRFEPRDPV